MLTRIRRLLAGNRLEIALITLCLTLWNSAAYAQTAVTAPITFVDGTLACPDCVKATAPSWQYGVVVGGSGQVASSVATDASTTKFLKSGGSSANPSWATISATVIDSGAASNGQVLTANGSGGATYTTISSGVTPVIPAMSDGPVSAGAGTVYMSLSGQLSLTEAIVRTPIKNNHTIANPAITTTVAPGGTSIVVTLGTGACTSGATYGSLTVTASASANTVVSNTTSQAVTGGNCAVWKIVKTGATAETLINLVTEITA